MIATRATAAAVLVVAALCIVPFAGKAFHIDDPFYLRIAQHILEHPLDYYGLSLNWYGREIPVYRMHVSPPLAPYYLAAWGAAFGFGEVSMHLAYLPFALVLIGATFALAVRLTNAPALAALLALFTPVTLVTSTNIMLDLPMSAFFVAAVSLWCEGVARNRRGLLIVAACVAGLSALTKYFGLALIPLLLAYTIAEKRRISWRVAPLVIPIALFALEQGCTFSLYGQTVFANAGDIARDAQAFTQATAAQRVAVGVVFAGGCLVPLIPYAFVAHPSSARATALLKLLVPALLIATFVFAKQSQLPWYTAPQALLFAMGGLMLFALVLDDLRSTRSPESVLLACWVLGTFLFATLLNWSVTARTFLPMVAPAALLLVRRLDRASVRSVGWRWVPVAVSAAVSLGVGAADYRWATSIRDAARQYGAQSAHLPGTVYFQGHWGWQHYMEQAGLRPLDVSSFAFQPNDMVISPENNANVAQIPERFVYGIRTSEFSGPRYVATMSSRLGAGFYTDTWGPLPFATGPVPPDRYHALLLGPPRSLGNY